MPTVPVSAAKRTSGKSLPSARESEKDPSSSSVPDVGKTATRKPQGKNLRRRPQVIGSEAIKNDVALLRAEGMAHRTVAKALSISYPTELHIANLPEVQERIASLREKYRLVAQERLGDSANKAFDLLDASLEKKDPQAFMRTSAGIVNMTKVSTETSGEKQKVEVSGLPNAVAPKVEIKNLLVALFGNPGESPTRD